MIFYDLTLTGFNIETDKTDDLVKWIVAPNRTAVELFAVVIGLDTTDIQSITPKDYGRPMTFEDGIDVVVDEGGQILQTSPTVDPFTWKELVCDEVDT